MSNSAAHPDHIADAIKKVPPSRCPHCGYTPGAIPSDFDAYAQANCEHRESHAKSELDDFRAFLEGRMAEQEKALGFAPAPLPGVLVLDTAIDDAVSFLSDKYPELAPYVGELTAHISDLTRRLAEAEAQLASREQELLDTLNRLVDERGTLRGKAEAAEARVRELEATIDAMAEAHAHDDQALTAAYLSGAHAGKKQAEAFKARVMAWARGRCECCEHKNVRREDTPCEQCLHTSNFDNWAPPSGWEDIA